MAREDDALVPHAGRSLSCGRAESPCVLLRKRIRDDPDATTAIDRKTAAMGGRSADIPAEYRAADLPPRAFLSVMRMPFLRGLFVRQEFTAG